MKNVSSWSFDAPLAKVDVPRIIDEAAAAVDSRGLGTLGVVKVTVSTRKGESIFVVADLDLAAEATLFRGLRKSDGIVCNDTRLDRDVNGGGRVNGLAGLDSLSVALTCICEGGLVIFAVSSDLEAAELINKLLDKVTVAVEVW